MQVGRRVGRAAGGHRDGGRHGTRVRQARGSHRDQPGSLSRVGCPGADDLGSISEFHEEFAGDFGKTRNIAFSRELNPVPPGFDAGLAGNKDCVPRTLAGAL